MKWILAALAIWIVWRLLSRKPALTDEDRARTLLGVGRRADADTIRAAYRRKVADAHPDRGGSGDDATRLNAARDLLLRRVD